MRTLFSHPLPFFGLILAALWIPHAAFAVGLPLPIGRLSDYGAVLDRYGRERVAASIQRVEEGTGIRVYVLASWESPMPDVESYAAAVFEAWRLHSGRTLLAVFLKTGRDWTASMVTSDAVRAEYSRIDERIERSIADLVAHDRIEEAMMAVLDALDSAARLKAEAEPGSRPGKPHGLSPATSVLLVVCGTVLLAVAVHRRVCPRCGFLLHSEAARNIATSRSRVYSCRRCGFRRQR